MNGAYNGFLDGFIDWYHDLFHFPTGARKIRPRNQFGDSLSIAGGPHLVRSRPGAYLGDVRLGAGFRHSSHWQTLVSATLPTNTGPEGFRRGTVSINAVTTIRSDFGKRFTYEGTLGARRDALARRPRGVPAQRLPDGDARGCAPASPGPFHLYTNLIYHSSLYHDTGTSRSSTRASSPSTSADSSSSERVPNGWSVSPRTWSPRARRSTCRSGWGRAGKEELLHLLQQILPGLGLPQVRARSG